MIEGSEVAPFEGWREGLVCPICGEFPLGRVVACSVGHSFCEECVNRQSSNTCSQCRRSMDGARNYMVEGILDQLYLSCPNRENGCAVQRLRRSAYKEHVENCQFSQVIHLCRRLGFSECQETFSFRDPRPYLQHVADGTHCSRKRVMMNEESELLIRSFRMMHEPDIVLGFSFRPTLFELDNGVKILITYSVPLAEGGGRCTNISFTAILMEDNRPAGGNSPLFVQFSAARVLEHAINWKQPVIRLEESIRALDNFAISPSISYLQENCMRMGDTQLNLQIQFIGNGGGAVGNAPAEAEVALLNPAPPVAPPPSSSNARAELFVQLQRLDLAWHLPPQNSPGSSTNVPRGASTSHLPARSSATGTNPSQASTSSPPTAAPSEPPSGAVVAAETLRLATPDPSVQPAHAAATHRSRSPAGSPAESSAASSFQLDPTSQRRRQRNPHPRFKDFVMDNKKKRSK